MVSEWVQPASILAMNTCMSKLPYPVAGAVKVTEPRSLLPENPLLLTPLSELQTLLLRTPSSAEVRVSGLWSPLRLLVGLKAPTVQRPGIESPFVALSGLAYMLDCN